MYHAFYILLFEFAARQNSISVVSNTKANTRPARAFLLPVTQFSIFNQYMYFAHHREIEDNRANCAR